MRLFCEALIAPGPTGHVRDLSPAETVAHLAAMDADYGTRHTIRTGRTAKLGFQPERVSVRYEWARGSIEGQGICVVGSEAEFTEAGLPIHPR